jgi:hypothetical protein
VAGVKGVGRPRPPPDAVYLGVSYYMRISSYVSIRQHTSAYVSIREASHTICVSALSYILKLAAAAWYIVKVAPAVSVCGAN